MALPSFADTEALQVWLGDEIPAERLGQADGMLAAASTLVRTVTGSAWVDAAGELEWAEPGEDEDPLDERLVIVGEVIAQVTVAAAARAYRNPSGFVSETTGPFSTRLPDDAGQGLYLTAEERRSLAAAVGAYRGSGSPGLWTLATTRNDTYGGDLLEVDGTLYLEVQGASEPIPYLPSVS